MLKEHVTYLKDNPRGYWFKAKLYGWGWVPVKWQGWLVVLLAIAILLAGIYVGEMDDAPGAAGLGLVLMTALIFTFGYWKGEKPRWQWGPRSVSGVAVVLLKDDQVLLTLRKAGQNSGTWELPAGHVKEGEEPSVTAVREVAEETGLVIAEPVLVDTYNKTNIYRAEIIGGQLENREPDQHAKVAWWPLGSLPGPLGPSAKKVLNIQKQD